jgi:nicotinate-nucleotide pyrophosphorylase (carboxylating)
LDWTPFIEQALSEDIGEGDHTALSCIPPDKKGKAQLIIKDNGILAGVELATKIFKHYDPQLQVNIFIHDGKEVKPGDLAFEVTGSDRGILTTERLVLNCMQRMSGIATLTNRFVKAVEGTKAQILDTRKTTPLFRAAEKWAVRIGGGHNHRMGLYDMILIKDNHIDFAGGVKPAIESVKNYLEKKNLSLPIEIESRNLEELSEILKVGGVNRIMLDNYPIDKIKEAVKLIDGKYQTEISGGVTLDSIRMYAETGVDFISVGALTHSYKSLDMSLKAVK